MKTSLQPNRGICTGDRGGRGIPKLNKKDRTKIHEAKVFGVMARMEAWSDAFLEKVLKENSSPIWQDAARRSLALRGHKVETPKQKKLVPDHVKAAYAMKYKDMGMRSAEKRWDTSPNQPSHRQQDHRN